MKGKYKKGGKAKKVQQRENELALAAKLMYLEGLAQEGMPTAGSQRTFLPGEMFDAQTAPEGDNAYRMTEYPWNDAVVVGKNSAYPSRKEDYSMELSMDQVRNAQFPKVNLPGKKISMYDNGGKTPQKVPTYDPYGFPVTDTTGTASYEKMAKYLLNKTGGSRERMEDLMYDIAAVESGRTFDPAIHQKGGGPGRGIFQYEGPFTPKSSNRAKDAVNRAISYYNSSKTEAMPKWLSSFIDESNGVYDFSKLSIPQQKVLFLADYSQADRIPFNAFMKGQGTTEDMWANYHKVSGADLPHFRELERLADKQKKDRTMSDQELRDMMQGYSYMPR